MTDLPDAWLLARNALDHHDTVSALAAGLEPLVADESGEVVGELSTRLAERLGRAGYALVRLDQSAELTTDLVAQIDQHLQDEAATSWFGRETDR